MIFVVAGVIAVGAVIVGFVVATSSSESRLIASDLIEWTKYVNAFPSLQL